VLEVCFASDLKRDPAGIWNPGVFLSETFRQKGIANRTWKRDVNGSAGVDVAYFRCVEAKLTASKPVRVS